MSRWVDEETYLSPLTADHLPNPLVIEERVMSF
jgi:hypothetical protein